MAGKTRTAAFDPARELAHAAGLGEARRVVLEGESAAALEEPVLCLHERLKVARCQRAVVEDGGASQSFDI